MMGRDRPTEASRRATLGHQLIDAASFRSEDGVKCLLEDPDTDIDFADGLGRTALFSAAAKGDRDIATLLTNAGADPRIPAYEKYGAIQLFANRGWDDLLEVALQRGISPDFTDEGGATLLMYAADGAEPRTADFLIARGAMINAKTTRTLITAIHLAASSGNVEMLERLAGAGAELEPRDIMGASPLHRAARAGCGGTCQWLLARGADVDAQTRHGYTPLMMAMLGGDAATAMTLLDAGANEALLSNGGTSFLRQLDSARDAMRQAYRARKARSAMLSVAPMRPHPDAMWRN